MQAQLKALMKDELKRAEALFGAVRHSDHESYAVLKEEVEEAMEEIEKIPAFLAGFWAQVKSNTAKMSAHDQKLTHDYKLGNLYALQRAALNAAEELIQVAAMCEKAVNTMEGEGDDD